MPIDGVDDRKRVWNFSLDIIWLTVILKYHVENRMFSKRKYNQNIYLKMVLRDISVKFDAHTHLWKHSEPEPEHVISYFPCAACMNVCIVKSDQAFSLFIFIVSR